MAQAASGMPYSKMPMIPMQIERYTSDLRATWDEFVKRSKNGTFLFLRDYMEYHNDRFMDHSLLIWDSKGRLLGLLPANLDAATLVSHGGLTYGGFLADCYTKLPVMLEMFDTTLTYLKELGVLWLLYKTIPYIYHDVPAEEDRYALFLTQPRWVRSGALAVLDSRSRLPYQERRSRGVKKARAQGLTGSQCDDFETYWPILTELLRKVYQTRPVHTLEEIRALSHRFPENIKLFGCFDKSEMTAGVVIYESRRVARVQYVASTPAGQMSGALDLLFDHLLSEIYRDKEYFDFGTSEQDTGLRLDRGLIDQKEGFGARAVALDHYVIDLSKWQPGSLVKACT